MFCIILVQQYNVEYIFIEQLKVPLQISLSENPKVMKVKTVHKCDCNILKSK